MYSIWDSTRRILMDYDNFHVMLYLSIGRSEYQQCNHKLNHCSCRHSVSILELSHGWYFSLLLVNLHLVVICLFACSWWLVVAGPGYFYYYCLFDNQWWQSTKVEVGSLPLGRLTGREQTSISGILRACISFIWGVTPLYLQFCTQVYL